MAAQFEECREKITEMPNIIKDLCRLLYYGKVRAPFLCVNGYLTVKCYGECSTFKGDRTILETLNPSVRSLLIMG